MISALLAAAVLAIAEPPTPTPTATPTPTPTATPAAAPRALDLSVGPSVGGAVAAVVLLTALSAVALLAARRRMRPGARIVEVVETTHLGPKRALVVARVQGDLLLLASSEAGITVLQSRPGLAPVQAPETAAAPLPTPAQASALSGMLGKLRRVRAPAGDPPAFDALLHESAEDLELRRKLAQGLGGSVR